MAISPTVRVNVSGARGASYADILRQTGAYGTLPTDSDAQAVARPIDATLALAGGAANYRATLAEGVADFAVGEYFSSAETGELRIYKRIATAPFYEDQGDEVAPFTNAQYDGQFAPDRSTLKNTSNIKYSAIYLQEIGRAGTFYWHFGDYTAAVAGDPQEGLYIPSDLVDPSIGCWVRDWDGIHGQPEWFHDGGDWHAAISACIALCPITLLGAQDYPISDTLVIQTENRILRGTARFNRTSNTGSRITMADASKDIVQVGYDAQPAGVPEQDAPGAGFLKNVKIENLAIWRTAAAAPWSNILDPTTVGAGLRIKYVLKCHFRDLLVQNSALNVYSGGAIYTKFDDVEARMDSPTSAGNYDTCRGWYLDGTIVYGYSGGNASIYLNRCVGVAGRRTGSTAANDIPAGLVAYGAFVDTFITEFEVAGTSKGMIFDGGAGVFDVWPRTVDLHINHPILDQVDSIGLECTHTGPNGSITVVDPYVASNGTAKFGISASIGAGISILGGQILGVFNSGDGTGTDASLRFGIWDNATVVGLRIHESAAPVTMEGCNAVEVNFTAINETQTAVQAINLKSCNRCRIIPKITGGAGKVTFGINLESGNSKLFMDVTGIADGPVTSDRIRVGGAGGSGIVNQGVSGTHFIVNPGQTFATS
jgi:hypothetical protein